MTPATLLEHLETWYRQGKLRLLDVSFARWCARHDPAPTPELLLVAALVAYLEGRGHSCLDLDPLLQQTLNLGTELEAALAQVLAELPRTRAAWQDTLYGSPCVAPPSSSVPSPLVLAENRLYLRRYWQYETALSQQIRQRTNPALWSLDALAGALPWLHALFPTHDAGIHWQRVACALALRSPFTLITGGPGTGKTHTVARLLTVLLSQSAHPEALRIALAAPTGKAAARLTESLRKALRELPPNLPAALDIPTLIEQVGPARTLHSLLGQDWTTRQFRHDAAHPLDLDLLIVDEASMVDLKMMVALFDALPSRSRIVLLGDRDQLASVEAGAVLGDLCLHAEAGHYRPETADFLRPLGDPPLPENLCDPNGSDLAQCRVMLRHSHRFGTAIGALAMAVNAGDVGSVTRLLKQETHSSLAWKECASPQEVVEIATCPTDLSYGKFSQLLQTRPAPADFDSWALLLLQALDQFRVLCALREGPWGVIELNRSIEQKLRTMGGLQPQGEWYEGRPVIITRNDADLSLANGDIGLTLRSPYPAQGLRVYFPDATRTLRALAPSRLNHVETAFALTVHKSQGSEFEHTCLVLPAPHPIVTRELIYTGITRARQRLTLLCADPTTLEIGLARPTQRTSGLKFEA